MAFKKKEKKKYHLKNNDREIIPVQNRIKLNPTTFIFLIVFVFLLIWVFRLVFRQTKGYYEVVEGNNGKTSTYSVFVSRDESIITSDRDGYVNYIASNGERVRVGQNICTIDENGDFLNLLLNSSSQENGLEAETLNKIKNSIRTFAISFDCDNYDMIYTEKSLLGNDIFSYLTDDIISSKAGAMDQYTFNIFKTSQSGIFTNTYDGYENFNPDSFKIADIEPEDYKLNVLKNNNKLVKGDVLYKLVNSDKFTIIFKMTEEDVVKYWESKTLDVYFPEIDKEITGDFSFVFAADEPDTRLVRVDFKDCGYLLAEKRITTIQINSSIVEGLKIPATSLTTKDYYIIPKNFLSESISGTVDGKTSTKGFTLQEYKNGTLTARFIEINSYKTYSDYILVDTSVFNVGDILLENDTKATYEVGATKSLQGVYNVNKGYTLFKPVEVLDEMSNGFIIIKKGVKGSVSIYDHIALNADMTKEGELIY